MATPLPLSTRTLSPSLTTFTIPFNRFAPLDHRNFVAVGNRMTAIQLSSSRLLVLNPIPLTPAIRATLDDLGGVHYIACDLGHHMYIAAYLAVWPDAKAIGVCGLEGKRGDVRWDFLCGEKKEEEERVVRPEEAFGFEGEMETVLFEGFITRAVTWYHRPSRTLVTSDLVMNLPCMEQYSPSSSAQGPGSRVFALAAHPRSVWFRRLIYYIATVDFKLMRRDAKRVAEWDIERIVPCHGDVIEEGGGEAWRAAYGWYLQGEGAMGWGRRLVDRLGFMRLVRWVFLM